MREEVKDKTGKTVALVENGIVTVLEPENIAQVMYDTAMATINKNKQDLSVANQNIEALKKALKLNL